MRMFPSIAIVCLLLLAGGFVLVCVPVSCQVSVSTPIKLSGVEYFVGVASVNGQAYASGFTSTGAGVVWQLNLQSGTLIPIAGSGSKAYIDGIGTSAAIEAPRGLVADPRPSHAGDLYFADVRVTTGSATPSFIRKLTLSTLNVTTVLGNGVACEYPYSATPPTTPTPALQSTACGVTALTMDGNGNLYYFDEVVLRVFNVDSNLVQTLVGSYGGNPGAPYVSGSGTSAYMPGPFSVTVVSDANGSETAIIMDAGIQFWIHEVNVSVGSPNTLITPSGQSGNVGFTCASRMNPDTFYMFTGCSNVTSGQLLSVNPTTLQMSVLAGGGGACATTDGDGVAAGFTQPRFCISLGGNANGETLIVADTTPSTFQGSPVQAGAIRVVTIGASPVTIPPSSTTSTPSGGGGHSSAADTIAVSVGSLFMSAVTVAVSVIAAAAI